ncbi:MAG: glycosyltransferase [Pseudomonadales bacterium]
MHARMRAAGLKVFIVPQSQVVHMDGATMGANAAGSRGKSTTDSERQTIQDRWASVLSTEHVTRGAVLPFHRGRQSNNCKLTIVVDHYIPEPDRDAGSRAMIKLCKELAGLPGNYVIFVPANWHRSAYAAALEGQGIEVLTGQFGKRRLRQIVQQLSHQVQHLVISRLSVAAEFSFLLDSLTCHKSIYIHDVETFRAVRVTGEASADSDRAQEALRFYLQEQGELLARFDSILSLSREETEWLAPAFGDKVVDIFPYEFQADSSTSGTTERTDLLFVGSFNHPPNVEGITWFVDNAWPAVHEALPEATLHLCGAGFDAATHLRQPGVVLHGHVSDGTLKWLYARSRVAVAPLLSGAGLKGKVIEAICAQVFCVGTAVAWQGLSLPRGMAYLSGDASSLSRRVVEAYEAHSVERARKLFQVIVDKEAKACGLQQFLADVHLGRSSESKPLKTANGQHLWSLLLSMKRLLNRSVPPEQVRDTMGEADTSPQTQNANTQVRVVRHDGDQSADANQSEGDALKALLDRANSACECGQDDTAYTLRAQAIALFEQRAESDGRTPWIYDEIIRLKYEAARNADRMAARYVEDDDEQALQWWRRASELLGSVANIDEEFQANFAFLHQKVLGEAASASNRLGTAADEAGEGEVALQHWLQGGRLIGYLLHNYPKQPQWVKDLHAVVLCSGGAVAHQLARAQAEFSDDARGFWLTASEMFGRALMDYPGQPHWVPKLHEAALRNAGICCQRTAQSLTDGSPGSAAEWWLKAIRLFSTLQRDYPEQPAWVAGYVLALYRDGSECLYRYASQITLDSTVEAERQERFWSQTAAVLQRLLQLDPADAERINPRLDRALKNSGGSRV